MNCFKILLNSYDEVGGMVYGPENRDYPIATDGEEVNDWMTLSLYLKDGKYCSFHRCVGGGNLVDEELKTLFEKYIDSETDVEFLPVMVHSEEYGDKQYYILHFLKIHDVIDEEHSVYYDRNDKSTLIKPAFSIAKVKGHHLFNSRPYINDVNVSEQLYKEIKKNKLNLGISFQTIRCF